MRCWNLLNRTFHPCLLLCKIFGILQVGFNVVYIRTETLPVMVLKLLFFEVIYSYFIVFTYQTLAIEQQTLWLPVQCFNHYTKLLSGYIHYIRCYHASQCFCFKICVNQPILVKFPRYICMRNIPCEFLLICFLLEIFTRNYLLVWDFILQLWMLPSYLKWIYMIVYLLIIIF